MEPKDGEERRDCWVVTFGNSYNSEERVVAAGYDNGDVKMFDLRTMGLRWESNLKNGVCGLEFDRKDIAMNKLVATTLEAKFYLFDLKTQHPKKGFSYLVEKVIELLTEICSYDTSNTFVICLEQELGDERLFVELGSRKTILDHFGKGESRVSFNFDLKLIEQRSKLSTY